MAVKIQTTPQQVAAIQSVPQWIVSQIRPRLAACSRAGTVIRRAALDLVYPAACASCHAELDTDLADGPSSSFCEACLADVTLFIGTTCRQCGVPVPAVMAAKENGNVNCPRCRGPKLWFDETIAAGEYTGRLREWLLRMKTMDGDSLSLAVGQLVWQQCGERLTAEQADVVVPVPTHWRRRVAHGTNSASVLAEVFSARLSVPLATGMLRRERHTEPQSGLPATQKWLNVRGAFSLRAGYYLRGARVLLVDDILTTGATCSAAARTLKRAGAERVSVVVVARWLSH